MNNIHKITDNQRRLYRQILKDVYEFSQSGKPFLADVGDYTIQLPIKGKNTDDLHELFKQINLDYERDDKGKVQSTARGKISSAGINQHISWIEKCAIESGAKLRHYEAELHRLSNFSQIETKIL